MRFIHKPQSKIKILDTPIFLDIETAWNHNKEDPICWMVSCNVRFNGKSYEFRKPTTLMKWYNEIITTYDINPQRKIFTIIHNQSYDLSYLLPYIQNELPYADVHSSICNNAHEIIVYQQGGLEFRCSYLLTNSSLEKLGINLNVKHKKQIGLYDYDKVHYQDDDLSSDEQKYDSYDTLCLEECYTKQLHVHGDDVTSVPLTATGYIRRMLRASCRKDKYYRERYFKKNRLDVESYKFCLNSYAGGYTHNNRWFKSKIVVPRHKGKVGKHRDFRSHYPTQLVCYPLPFGKPHLYYDRSSDGSRLLHPNISISEILDLYPKFSTITQLFVTKMELKSKDITMPFMQVSKMFMKSDESSNYGKCRYHADNGRLLKMYSGSFVTYVDNHTLKILMEQYNISGLILKVYRFANTTIPDCMRNVIDELFKQKSDLKHKHKECEKKYGKFDARTLDANFYLLLSKQLLNAIYGCLATNPCRETYDIDYTIDVDDEEQYFKCISGLQTDEEIEESLNKYYSGRNNFLPYQVGCFVTALARYELYEYIKVIGYKNVLYCDTDSIFYLSDDEIENRVEQLNKEKAKTAPFVIDNQGNKIQYDVFEEEPDFLAFKGLHSKCYGIVAINPKTNRKELQVTIAGVPSQTLIAMDGDTPIYLTREEELCGITKEQKIENPNILIDKPYFGLNRLDHNRTFYVNTGTTCAYTTTKPYIAIVDGHTIETAGGAIIQKLESKKVRDIDCDEMINYKCFESNIE